MWQYNMIGRFLKQGCHPLSASSVSHPNINDCHTLKTLTDAVIMHVVAILIVFRYRGTFKLLLPVHVYPNITFERKASHISRVNCSNV